MQRVPLWVERQEKELRLVEGDIELEGDGRFSGHVSLVFPLDDLTSAERQEAEDRILKAERAQDEKLLADLMARGQRMQVVS